MTILIKNINHIVFIAIEEFIYRFDLYGEEIGNFKDTIFAMLGSKDLFVVLVKITDKTK